MRADFRYSVSWLLGLLLALAGSPATAETVGPWPEITELLASDSESWDRLGWSVALSGDTALVGAFGDGSAYVFVRSGDVWTEQAKLLASDGYSIGSAVALSGDTALVGAPTADNDNGDTSGAAYVFTRSDGVWTEQTKLLASDGAETDELGVSVALDGDTALVGATLYQDKTHPQSGAAYLFVRSEGEWTEQAKLVPNDAIAFGYFGWSVALSGDTALVGAYGDDDNGDTSGSAYVFVRLGNFWLFQAKLQGTGGSAFDSFGAAVALSGDTALIGAYRDYGDESGSAFVFERSNAVWTEQVKLRASDGAAEDYFGASVALSGTTALVGAVLDDDNGDASGSAYVFTKSDGVWSAQAKLVDRDNSEDDHFGASVALSGDTALIGAPSDDLNSLSAGAVHVFGRQLLFQDGFESGDTTAWSVTVP